MTLKATDEKWDIVNMRHFKTINIGLILVWAAYAGTLLMPKAAAHARHVRPVSLVAALVVPADQTTAAPITVVIDTDAHHALNHFSPLQAFGAGVDGVLVPHVPQIYTKANVTKILSAGMGSVSYRLYTELSVQDWHWNPKGLFSTGKNEGYWISQSAPGTKTLDTFGYRLPRRGNTTDQGNNDDYSRLDDGDLNNFWKSNPYLSSHFTGEPDAQHPQWVLVDLGKATTIDTARIVWASPYATRYSVEYWQGDDAVFDPANGKWVSFPNGVLNSGSGGRVTTQLGQVGHKVQFVRVLMTQSSGTCVAGGHDVRDCTGFAISELGFGTTVGGTFQDVMKHRPDLRQTLTYASSTDPWHRAIDRVQDQEQPGFDIVVDSGITRGLPLMVPVSMLFSTPENAAAEIRYLKARGASIASVELGEEPDGQYIAPEDYAALYLQWARALHAVDPSLILGGPSFQSTLTAVQVWPDAAGETSWTKRFLAALARHNRMGDLGFFSFEHYPFEGCNRADTQQNLLKSRDLIESAVQAFRADGMPSKIPFFITETNYSANQTDVPQDIAGAIWLADFYGGLLSAGGAGGFFYEYEPIPLGPSTSCPGVGTFGLLLGNAQYQAGPKLSQYFAAHILTTRWAQPGDGQHTLFPAQVNGSSTAWVSAYPLQRPDGSWSVLLVNRDLSKAHDVTLNFGTNSTKAFQGLVQETTFSSAQYVWVRKGQASYPDPDGPATHVTVAGDRGHVYTLPKASITVLQGRIGG